MAVDNLYNLLRDFSSCNSISLNEHIQNDIIHLLVKQGFDMYVGIAYVKGVCDPPHNCEVDHLVGHDLKILGHIIKHEKGHNLDIQHDNGTCSWQRSFA